MLAELIEIFEIIWTGLLTIAVGVGAGLAMIVVGLVQAIVLPFWYLRRMCTRVHTAVLGSKEF